MATNITTGSITASEQIAGGGSMIQIYGTFGNVVGTARNVVTVSVSSDNTNWSPVQTVESAAAFQFPLPANWYYQIASKADVGGLNVTAVVA